MFNHVKSKLRGVLLIIDAPVTHHLNRPISGMARADKLCCVIIAWDK